jgi:hypothetical protein
MRWAVVLGALLIAFYLGWMRYLLVPAGGDRYEIPLPVETVTLRTK